MTDRADISTEEVVGAGLTGALLDVHTALPGIVMSYDASKGTCDVRPAVKRALPREDDSIAYESLPVIPNVRVCWPGAGGFELHLPLAKGDTVLLVFSEADTSGFERTGQESNPGWLERHGLHSPVAYPYNRQPKATTGGARLVAPSPFVVGDPVTATLVALSDKVDAAIAAVVAWSGTHVHSGVTTGPGSSGPTAPIPPQATTAGTKLKVS